MSNFVSGIDLAKPLTTDGVVAEVMPKLPYAAGGNG